MVILFCGFDGSGKTTLAEEVQKCFPRAVLLDSDTVSEGINKNSSDEFESIRRVAEMAKLLDRQRVLTIITEVCSTEDERNIIKDIVGEDNLYVVYLSTPLEICKTRSSKYESSEASESDEPTEFELPRFCNLILDTSNRDIKSCVREIIRGFRNGIEPNHAYKKYNFYNMKEDMWRLNYRYKYAVCIIAKCASTQLKAWCDDDNIPYAQGLIDNGDSDMVLMRKGKNIKRRMNIERYGVVDSIDKIPEGFVKFAVYRDPLERFNSACHFPGYDAKKVMEEFTNYTYEDGVCKDQHMRRQSDFYKPEDVDYIVKLSDLNDFLKVVFDDDVTIKRKVEHPVFKDVDMTLTESEQEALKNYYIKDWDIEKSDKVWVNPNAEK